ncbi:hypothetical protein B0H17DRAFT_1152874, partial [Mycena rosella]
MIWDFNRTVIIHGPIGGFDSWEISVTPNTRDIEQQLFSRMDVCDNHAMLMAFPSLRHVKLSVHDCIPFGKLATVVGDLLDFHVHFPDSERSKVEPRVGPWWAYRTPIRTDIASLDSNGH